MDSARACPAPGSRNRQYNHTPAEKRFYTYTIDCETVEQRCSDAFAQLGGPKPPRPIGCAVRVRWDKKNMNTKAHCNTCDGEKNHEVLFTTRTSWNNDEFGIGGADIYEVLKCGGCDQLILKHTSRFSEEPEPRVRYYPPSAARKEPRWMYDMSGPNVDFVRALLKEIYIGVQNDTTMTATMGVRALLEHVMISVVGDNGSFTANLEKFTEQGNISVKQRDILDAVLEAGHAAIHRAYQPTDEDLITCIDIAESVLQTVYVHPEKAAELAKKIPRKK